MCWSAAVSQCFAAVELIICAYLWYRQRHFDRDNALLHLPLVLQEGLQALLWSHVDSARNYSLGWDDPSLHMCSHANTRYSYLIVVIVGGVPAWFALRVAREVKEHNAAVLRGVKWRRLMGPIPSLFSCRRSKTYLGIYIVAACGFAYLWLYLPAGSSDWFARCTTRGTWGHQIWPMLVCRWKWLEIAMAVFYYMQGGEFKQLPRPALLVPLLSKPLSLLAVVCYAVMGPEAGSVWCWSASCLCFAYLIEPYLIDALGILDLSYIDDSEEANERRRSMKASHPARYWTFNYMWLHQHARRDFITEPNHPYDGQRNSPIGFTNMLPWRDHEPLLGEAGPRDSLLQEESRAESSMTLPTPTTVNMDRGMAD